MRGGAENGKRRCAGDGARMRRADEHRRGEDRHGGVSLVFVCFGGQRGAYRDRQPLSGAQVQRAPSFMLVDEADSILLDEAVTPMILSGQGGTLNPMLMAVDRFVGWLKKAEVQALSDEDEYLRLDGEVDYIGMPLREAAAFSKSWELEEASVGVAAINAWHNRAAWLPVRENADAFLRYRSRAERKRVGVIGRFACLEKRLEPICDLYVIERRPGAKDYPDAACEYLLPEMDAVFITGSTAANKTLPRLLELSRYAFTAVCGPSMRSSSRWMAAKRGRLTRRRTRRPTSGCTGTSVSRREWRAAIS